MSICVVSIKTEKRELDHIRLPLRLFARCVVRQLQKEQPFIRTKHPPGKLRRPVACLDDTRMLHLFDVLPILRPLHRGEGQLCVLIRGSQACSSRCKRSLIARFGSKHTDHPLLVKGIGFPLQGVTSLACFFGPLDGRIAVKHNRAQKFIRRLLREDVCIAEWYASLRCALAGRAYASAPCTPNTMK